MSIVSQEKNMRRLANLLSHDLGYIWGEKECGPNGEKKTFLHLGNVFLRALAKDLGLHNVTIRANPGGIAVSGECTMIGMWEENGIYVCITQTHISKPMAIVYRTVRHAKDYTGGHNNWISVEELGKLSYRELLSRLTALRKEVTVYDLAA